METKIMLMANLKKHKNGLAGIFVVMLLAMTALGTALTVWSNSDTYVRAEIVRAGFGDLTIWVSGVPDNSNLTADIESLPEIERVEVQPLIYSNYTANEQESDSEGQLILYHPEENRYHF